LFGTSISEVDLGARRRRHVSIAVTPATNRHGIVGAKVGESTLALGFVSASVRMAVMIEILDPICVSGPSMNV